jgi:hypothetical protein
MRDGLKTGIEHWWIVLCVGLILFLLSITRNIGIVALGVILFYLLIEKKFFLAGYTLAGFLVFRLPFSLYKKIAWDVESANMQGQLSEILLKNPYNRSLGREDFGGMVDRFLENSEIYLSRLLMVASGLRSPDYSETSTFFTILLYLIFALAIYMAFKHSKVMKFTGIYLGLAIAATFIALQQQWGQMRMVIIYVPLIFLFLPWGLLEATKSEKVRGLQPVLVILLLVMFFNLFGLSVKRAQENKVALMKNLRGDRYYGYTQDWVNFLKMSEWAADNVPEESMIASRKPSMSFIYGDGRSFYGVYRFPSIPADTVLSRMAAKTTRPIVVNERELSTGGIPRQMVLGMRRGVESFLSLGDSMYSVYFFPDEARDGFISMLEQYDVRYDTDLDILNRKLAQSGKPGLAVVPDTLVNMLLRNNVDYIIRGSLRLNPAQKTERVINTVHRYMYYMEQKYLGIFSQVSQVGGNNDEPAYLFRIHWDRFGLDSPTQ